MNKVRYVAIFNIASISMKTGNLKMASFFSHMTFSKINFFLVNNSKLLKTKCLTKFFSKFHSRKTTLQESQSKL